MEKAKASGKEGRRKLFSPAGPITARHSKKQEWLIPQSQSVWNKSGPPTKEARVLKTDYAQPLVNLDDPAEHARAACVNLRRDLNLLLQKKGSTGAGLILRKEVTPAVAERSQDLWEALEFTSLTKDEEIYAKTIARLNQNRSTDEPKVQDPDFVHGLVEDAIDHVARDSPEVV